MAYGLSEEFLKAAGATEDKPLPYIATVPEATLRAEMDRANRMDSDVTFASMFSKASQEEHIHSALIRNSYRFSDTPMNPVSDIDDEMLEALTGGLDDPDAIEEVLDAARSVSLDYAMQMGNDYRITAQNRKDLAAAGWMGTSATLLAALFDPTELAAIGATSAGIGLMSGTAAPVTTAATAGALFAKRAYNVGRAARLGLAAGAVEASAFEAVRASLKYDVDGGDVLLAGLIGGTLGGTVGGVTTAFAKQAKLHDVVRKVAQGEELTPNERLFYEANSGDRVTQRIFDEVDRRGDLEDPDATPLPEEPTVAARAVGEITEEEARATSKQLGGTFLAPLRSRLSVFHQTKNSNNGFVRTMADRLGLNSSGNVDRTTVNASATEIKSMLEHTYRGKFARTMHKNRKAWKKRTGGDYADFNILVSRAIRGGLDETVDTEVRAVAKDVMDAQRELGQKAIKYNVAGFTTGILDNQPNYLPRIFSDTRINALRSKYGDQLEDAVSQLVQRAIRNAQPNIEKNLSPDVISDMSRGYAKTILNREYSSIHRTFEFNMEDLQKALKGEGLDDNTIGNIIDNLTRNTAIKGHKRSRPRLTLDENTSVDIRMADGSYQSLKFSDLLEEDIENLHNAYVFQMSGAIGLARNGINTNDLSSSFDTMVSKIQNEAQAIGQSADEMNQQIDALRFMYDSVTGRLAFRDGQPTASTRKILRRGREASFIMHMGMSGMAAMMELTNVLMEYSIPVLLKAMPQYGKMIRLASDGKLDNALLRELEELTGLGTDVVTGKFTRVSRFEGDTMDIEPDADFTKTDEWLGKGREIMSFASGLSPVTAGLRRLSMLNYSTAWARAARQNNNPFADIKMEQLGISEDLAQRIRNQINSKATYKGNVLESLNTKDWDDAEALDAFQVSVYREATQSVQEVSIGSLNPSLRGEWGKTLFQFMSFPMAALEQQAMRMGVRAFHGDATTVAKIIMSASFMGTLMYTSRIYMNAEGRSDKEEYIKRMMTPAMIAKGALGQVGATSTFATIVDITTGTMSGNNYALTPASLSILEKAGKVGTIAGKQVGLFEGDASESEIRSGLRLIPYASLYGARQGLNWLANQAAN